MKSLADRSRGWTEDSFSIATSQGVEKGANPLPGFPLILDPYLLWCVLSQENLSTIFESLVSGLQDHCRTL